MKPTFTEFVNRLIATPVLEWQTGVQLAVGLCAFTIVLLFWLLWNIEIKPRITTKKFVEKFTEYPGNGAKDAVYLLTIREMMQKEIDEAIERYRKNFTTILHEDDKGEAERIVNESIKRVRSLPLDEQVTHLASCERMTRFNIVSAINKRKGLM